MSSAMSAYDSKKALAQYLFFHYPEPTEFDSYPNAPLEGLRFIEHCVGLVRRDLLSETSYALDLGCAVGRASFELSCFASRVVGVDLSSQFVGAANAIKDAGFLDYAIPEEGELFRKMRAAAPRDANREAVTFEVGDALAVREILHGADIVLALNLIDRVREPASFLKSLSSIVKPGGQLVLGSPFSWLADFTPRENWLGGYSKEGKDVRAKIELVRHLSDSFTIDEVKDIPFVIREHARLYQWGVANVTRWLKK